MNDACCFVDNNHRAAREQRLCSNETLKPGVRHSEVRQRFIWRVIIAAITASDQKQAKQQTGKADHMEFLYVVSNEKEC